MPHHVLKAKSISNLKTIKILYEDEQCMVIDKPAQLLVIPSPKNEKKTLVSIVNDQIKSYNNFKLHPCHRLDRDTTGTILFAKGKKNQQKLMALFQNRLITKKYIALVHGKIRFKAGELKSPIVDFDQKKYKKPNKEKFAITRYKVLKAKKDYSLVEIHPITGRTNQIRIHFSEMGHPLLGERKYAFAKDYPLKFKRTALHALSLQWRAKGKTIFVDSPWPKDINQFIQNN